MDPQENEIIVQEMLQTYSGLPEFFVMNVEADRYKCYFEDGVTISFVIKEDTNFTKLIQTIHELYCIQSDEYGMGTK